MCSFTNTTSHSADGVGSHFKAASCQSVICQSLTPCSSRLTPAAHRRKCSVREFIKSMHVCRPPPLPGCRYKEQEQPVLSQRPAHVFCMRLRSASRWTHNGVSWSQCWAWKLLAAWLWIFFQNVIQSSMFNGIGCGSPSFWFSFLFLAFGVFCLVLFWFHNRKKS